MGREHERKLNMDIVVPPRAPSFSHQSAAENNATTGFSVDAVPNEENSTYVSNTAAPDFARIDDNARVTPANLPGSENSEGSSVDNTGETIFSDDNPFVTQNSTTESSTTLEKQSSPDVDPETGLPIPDYMKPFLNN